MTNVYLENKKFKYISLWPSNNILKKIVVTCFLQKEDKILILQRARKDAQFGLWGIPGGKLDNNETPLEGLLRELKEELKLQFSEKDFTFLGRARSYTESDGEYGLYLFHALFPSDDDVSINKEEHLDFKWVTLEEFENSKLLFAQGEAYYFVENNLKEIYQTNLKKIQGEKK
ncbi:MAG: hypothetical protein A3F40_04945 [Chlamydiae bacterium RIFCSPHIGHO2_12_FULL_27_8]|nr:MAG: hypothetical protein A3F40_04945 [Chlamydiae bacterium RIFCSPHIGHO2_12_FULL_27_8]